MDRKMLLAFAVTFMMVSVSVFVLVDDSYGATGNLDVSAEHGTVTDLSTGKEYTGGLFTGELRLSFTADSGYEFVQWDVVRDEGAECAYTTEHRTITITSVTGDVRITPVIRNYSTSHGLMSQIDVDNLLSPEDDIVNNWSFASERLSRVGSNWYGMPSTPLIVGDTVYVRAAKTLYALDAEHGTVKNSVASADTYLPYHYISYGGGVIFDVLGHKAFDLDLNYLYDLPKNLEYATYYDGYFYGYLNAGTHNGVIEYCIFKTSSDRDSDLIDGVKQNLSKNTETYQVFNQYGQHSPLMIQKDWMFFLEVGKKPGINGNRFLTAYNPETEKTVTCNLTGFKDMPWDDGWLTFYDDYFYLTAYTAGLFDGVLPGLEAMKSSVMWVRFDFETGQFDTPHFEFIKTEEGDTFSGIASGLVIHNGRGYINVRASPDDTMGQTNDTGTCMISFDIGENGKPIPRQHAPSYMTHGGIVVNTAHENEGRIHIYLIPYDMGAQGIYIFTDELIKGTWVLNPEYSKKAPTQSEWCSQGIRAGPNGEIIYYVDRGYIDCYIPDTRNKITFMMMDSDSARSEVGFGKNPATVLQNLEPSAAIAGGTVTIGSEQYDAYGFNEVKRGWYRINNLYDSVWSGTEKEGITVAPYHYVTLLEKGSDNRFISINDDGWYYLNDSWETVKCDMSSTDSIDLAANHVLRYFHERPYGLILPKVVDVMYNGSTTFAVSKDIPWTYEVADESVASFRDNGDGTMTATYVSEGSVNLVITSEGVSYDVLVETHRSGYYDEEGYYVSRVLTEEVDEIGNTIKSAIVTRSMENKVNRTTESSIYDPDGKLIRTENLYMSNNHNEYFYDGHWIDTKNESTLIKDAAGNRIVDSVYGSEMFEYKEIDGTIVTNIMEVYLDKIRETQNKIETVQWLKDSVIYEEKSDIDENDRPVNTVKRSYSSTNEANHADVIDGAIIVHLESGYSVNLIDMVKVLQTEEPMPVYINIDTVVSESIMASAYKVNGTLIYSVDEGSIALNAEILEKFNKIGPMTFEISKVDDSKLNDAQKQALKGLYPADITLRCGEAYQHDFGVFTVHLNMVLEDLEGKEVMVWRIDGSGHKLPADNVTYSNGYVSFDADHLSIYAVGYIDSNPSPGGPVKSVFLDRVSADVLVGDSFKLNIRVGPAGAAYDKVSWRTDNADVATVEGGTVRAVGPGTANVTVTVNGVSSACSVTVRSLDPVSIAIDQAKVIALAGNVFSLHATVFPDYAVYDKVEWRSFDRSVATVDQEGNVTCVGEGSTTIVAIVNDLTVHCAVIVSAPVPAPESISLDVSELSLKVGGEHTFIAEVFPAGTDYVLVWSSNNEDIVTVRDGHAIALHPGIAKISARCGAVSCECIIDVAAADIMPETVELDKAKLSMKIGGTAVLTPSVGPEGSAYWLTWSSSDPLIASVDGGMVKALNAGTAVITVKAGDKEAHCTVDVDKPPGVPDSLVLSHQTIEMTVGDTKQIYAYVKPVDSMYIVLWSSYNDAIVTVKDGLMTARAEGETFVLVTAGPNCSELCKVTVKESITAPTKMTLNAENITIEVGETFKLVPSLEPRGAISVPNWRSQDVKVATVEDGSVTGVYPGTTKIIAQCSQYVHARCTVTVKVPDVLPNAVTLDHSYVEMEIGDTFKLTPTVTPADSSYTSVWRSTDETCVQVKDGILSAITPGRSTISFSTGYHTATCDVKVKLPPTMPTSVVMEKTDLHLGLGDAVDLKADVYPFNAMYTLVWGTDRDGIVSVDDGRITVLNPGTVKVYAYAGDVFDTCTVTIDRPPSAPQRVDFDLDRFELTAGQTLDLNVSVYPADSTYHDLFWESDNTDAVTVDGSGRLTAHGPGTAHVSVRAGNVTGVCTVEVVSEYKAYSLKYIGVAGSVLGEFELMCGDAVPEPAQVPQRDGYRFSGWNAAVPTAMPAEDLSFTAAWTPDDEPDRVFTDNPDGTVTKVYRTYAPGDSGRYIMTEVFSTELPEGNITSQTTVIPGSDVAEQVVTVRTEQPLTTDDVLLALRSAGYEADRIRDDTLRISTSVSIGSGSRDTESFHSEAASELRNAGAGLRVKTSNATVVLDRSVCGTIGAVPGILSLSAVCDPSALSDGQKESIGGSRFLDLRIGSEGGSVSALGGDASVSVPFSAGPGMTVSVWHVDDSGKRTPVASQYSDGTVTFSTDHFSVFVMEETEVLPETHRVTVSPADNGTVTSSAAEAAEGSEVKLTVTPADGYRLKSLVAGRTVLKVTEGCTEYTFAMPSEDAIVTAVFEKIPAVIPVPEDEGGTEGGSDSGNAIYIGIGAAVALLAIAGVLIAKRRR